MSIPLPLDLFTPIASNYIPVARLLANVTNDVFAVVTTTQDHGYLDGQYVRMIVPGVYGMVLDYVQTAIVVTGTTTFTTDIDTTLLKPFVAPSFTGNNAFTQAQCVPITGMEWNIAPKMGVYPPAFGPVPPNGPYFGPPVPVQNLP